MPTHYVFIDYENVRPFARDLAVLDAEHLRFIVFVGPEQTKLNTDLVLAMQRLGPRGEWIQITGQGPNALDFHIAFYLGRLVEQDPAARFHIISKDKGFDPLLQHLKQRKILLTRTETVTDIPVLKAQLKQFANDNLQKVIDHLSRPGATKPATRKALTNTIAMLLQKEPESIEVEALMNRLQSRNFLTINGDAIVYMQAT